MNPNYFVRGPQNPNAAPIPKGVIARVSGMLRAGVSAMADAWNGWFAPLPPTTPIAPDAPVRTWQFPVGQNIAQAPKTAEGITYENLRGIANNYDILRLAIETRKDQVAKLEWAIRPKDEAKQKMDAATEQRVDDLTAFFMRPDRINDWPQWIRLLLENIFVYDAAAVYRRPTVGGGIYALDVLDGTTIKRLIDNTGRTPEPPLPAYQQWLYGVPASDLTTDELLFSCRNPMPGRLYGYSPVEQIICTANIGLRRASQQLNFFTEGTVPEGFVSADPNWGADEIEKAQQRFDAAMAGNQKLRSRLVVVPSTFKFEWPKTASLFDAFDEWLVRIVCYAFSLPPTPFIKQMNRATAVNAQEVALEEGLQPIMNYLQSFMTRLLAWTGNDDLEWTWQFERDVDPEVQAKVDEIYVKSAIVSINEVRERMGKDPIDGGDVHGFVTAVGFTPLARALLPPAPPPALLPGKPKQLGPGAPDPTAGKIANRNPYQHEGFHELQKRLTALEGKENLS